MKTPKDAVRNSTRSRDFGTWARGQGGQGAMPEESRPPAAPGAPASPLGTRRPGDDGQAN